MSPEVCPRRFLFFFLMHVFHQRTSNLTDSGAVRAPSQVYQLLDCAEIWHVSALRA